MADGDGVIDITFDHDPAWDACAMTRSPFEGTPSCGRQWVLP
jgi:hypothetical protein